MKELLGLSYSSVWWAFLFLMAFCLISTPADRLLGRLAGKMFRNERVRQLIHLALDILCNAAILFVMDWLMSSVSITWWSLAVLAVAMGVMMVYSGGKTEADQSKADPS